MAAWIRAAALEQLAPGRLAINYSADSEIADGLTHGIVGVFTSSAAHDAYQVSPAHQEMKAFMTTRMARIVVLDTDQGA